MDSNMSQKIKELEADLKHNHHLPHHNLSRKKSSNKSSRSHSPNNSKQDEVIDNKLNKNRFKLIFAEEEEMNKLREMFE